jgi:hypothetical protein
MEAMLVKDAQALEYIAMGPGSDSGDLSLFVPVLKVYGNPKLHI